MTWVFLGWLFSGMFMTTVKTRPVSGDWTLDGTGGQPPQGIDGTGGQPPQGFDGTGGQPPQALDGTGGQPPARL